MARAARRTRRTLVLAGVLVAGLTALIVLVRVTQKEPARLMPHDPEHEARFHNPDNGYHRLQEVFGKLPPRLDPDPRYVDLPKQEILARTERSVGFWAAMRDDTDPEFIAYLGAWRRALDEVRAVLEMPYIQLTAEGKPADSELGRDGSFIRHIYAQTAALTWYAAEYGPAEFTPLENALRLAHAMRNQEVGGQEAGLLMDWLAKNLSPVWRDAPDPVLERIAGIVAANDPRPTDLDALFDDACRRFDTSMRDYLLVAQPERSFEQAVRMRWDYLALERAVRQLTPMLPELRGYFEQGAEAILTALSPFDLDRGGNVPSPLRLWVVRNQVTRLHNRYLGLLTLIALERYCRAHGVYPDTLDALIPGLLSELPTDAYGNYQPLRYRLDRGGCVLYSVGTDGRDNGGGGGDHVVYDTRGPLPAGAEGAPGAVSTRELFRRRAERR